MPKRQKPKTPAKGDVRPTPPPLISISFKHCRTGKRFCLSHCGSDDIQRAIEALRTACSLDWNTFYKHNGLNPEQIADSSLKVERPAYLDKSKPICSIRASRSFRILWYRSKNVLYALWFDPNHDAYNG